MFLYLLILMSLLTPPAIILSKITCSYSKQSKGSAYKKRLGLL